jgi:septal ring factor EnvC (AmiA/AmiB activator)
MINKARGKHHGVTLDFIALALRGKNQGGFDKVIKMIDDMTVQLGEDQKADEAKKSYCEKEFDTSEDKKKEIQNTIEDIDTAIEDSEEAITTVKAEIEALSDGIRALDHSVEDATEERKAQNTAWQAKLAGDTACKDLIGMAKKRLNEMSAPPRDIIKMLDDMVAGLDKGLTVGKAEEADAQEDYEKMMADSADKRAEDSKTMTDKESALAEMMTELESHKEDKMSAFNELMENGEYIANLHTTCDWLLENFEARKAARKGEIEAMAKAKDVLNGADYSLLQLSMPNTVTRRFLRKA